MLETSSALFDQLLAHADDLFLPLVDVVAALVLALESALASVELTKGAQRVFLPRLDFFLLNY